MPFIEKILVKKDYSITRSVLLIFMLSLVFVFPKAKAQDTLVVELERLPGQFREITSLFITPTPHLFLVESGRNRILRLSLDGQRLDSLGRTGSGTYQFDTPLDIDATNELKIFVSDYNNNRIQVFDRRLQFLSTVRLPRIGGMQGYRPTVLTVNNLGELFFYDEESEYIYKFNFNGGFEQRFSTRGEDRIIKPSSMAALDDAVFVADPAQSVVHILTVNGRYIGFISGITKPGVLAVWGDQVFISNGNEIVVYGLSARYYGTYKLTGFQGEITGMAIFRNKLFVTNGRTVFSGQRPPLRR